MVTVSDLDGTPTNVTWQWARGASTGGPFVEISGATFASYSVLADDVNNYLQITASYTDPEGMGKSATALTGRVGAGNTKPYFSSDTATRTLPENSAAGVNVVGGEVTATDDNVANDFSRDTLTYTLTGTDAGSFEIDAIDATDEGVDQGVQIKTKTGTSHNFNFEATKKIYTVTVNVRDSKDSAGYADTEVDDTIVVTITLTNVNEAPSVTGTLNKSEGENRAVSVPIGNYTATDPDASTTFTWTLEGNDADDFEINPQGELRLLSSPDYESPTDSDTNNVYNVTVKVSDGSAPRGPLHRRGWPQGASCRSP